ncbi:hypothetical protein EBR96_08715, partial [bacterium]|nr:hypothetical protein [bacterium]
MSVFLLPCTAIGMIIGALIHYRFVIGIGLLAFAILVGISAAFRTGNRRAPFGMLIVFISVMSAWQYARFRDMPPDSHEMPEIVRIDTVPILKNEKWRALGTDPQSHRQWLIFFGESVPSYGDLIRVQGRIL